MKKKMRFSFKEVAIFTLCGVALGAALITLGEKHVANKGGTCYAV